MSDFRFIGEDDCEGVKTDGGVIAKAMSEIEIACLAGNIPEAIEIDITNLMLIVLLMIQYKIGKQLYLQALGQIYHAYYPFGWIFPAMKESLYEMGGRNHLIGIGFSVGYQSPLGPVSISIGKEASSTFTSGA